MAPQTTNNNGLLRVGPVHQRSTPARGAVSCARCRLVTNTQPLRKARACCGGVRGNPIRGYAGSNSRPFSSMPLGNARGSHGGRPSMRQVLCRQFVCPDPDSVPDTAEMLSNRPPMEWGENGLFGAEASRGIEEEAGPTAGGIGRLPADRQVGRGSGRQQAQGNGGTNQESSHRHIPNSTPHHSPRGANLPLWFADDRAATLIHKFFRAKKQPASNRFPRAAHGQNRGDPLRTRAVGAGWNMAEPSSITYAREVRRPSGPCLDLNPCFSDPPTDEPQQRSAQ
jgi:hypothetical protein